MKRGIIILALVISLISFVSAEIIFTQPLSPAYNLGDSVFVPVTIKTLNEVSGIFQMKLICNSTETAFYTTGIKLKAGEEITLIDPNLVLIRTIIGENKGECKVKAILNSEYVLTNTFKISNTLVISGELEKTEFDAGEGISITGEVTRETGENSNGFVEANVLTGDLNEEIKQIGTITDGIFNVNLSLPVDMKAGNYFVEVKAYEEDSEGVTTNSGVSQYNIRVKQVPTNLELILGEKEVMPRTPLMVNAILHDQTGDPINSTVFITVKDSAGKIIEQKEMPLGEIFALLIKSDQPPEEWTVDAISNSLTSEEKFRIKANMEADIQIINKTVVVTNIGNVFYNKTLLVRVGDSPLNILVGLEVGNSKKYVITAPDGEYNVKISEGDKEVNELMSLTGNAVEIKEASNFSVGFFFWIFLIGVLGFIVFFFVKKLYKKPFFEKIIHGRKKDKFRTMTVGEDLRMTPKKGNKAELSLSIKEGEKQDASVICLKIKDLKDMKGRKSRVSETIERIVEMAEENNAVVYENQDYLFFILAPARTRTFKNEKAALDLAEKIKYLLEEHNRSFNQKIEFGLSLNYGAIIGKQEGDLFKFMSMGSLITASKKIAYLSEEEILLSDKINDLLRLHTKTERSIRGGIPVFSIKEIKKEVDDATKKFISRFMERQKRGD
ncbi:MAG: hypothetical protein M1416_02910 [Candidatus Pacearchaeota archaeon]|nr:hypothetical protein [Candidatus Pacearchaeota archaeon]